MRIVEPELGDTRVKHRFLWFPITIGKETRWLEKATYLQQYKLLTDRNGWYKRWINVKWID